MSPQKTTPERAYSDRLQAERRREAARAENQQRRQAANEFTRKYAIPDRLKGKVKEHHVALAAHEMVSENYTLRPSLVFERAAKIASRETSESREAWAAVVTGLRERLPSSSIAMWVDPLGFPKVGQEDELIVLGHTSIVSWFGRRYRPLAEEILAERTRFKTLTLEDYE